MNNPQEIFGFIIHDLDGGIIWGLGQTEEAAWADAHASAAKAGRTLIEDDVVILPATGRLLAQVVRDGGDTRWMCIRINGKVVADVR